MRSNVSSPTAGFIGRQPWHTGCSLCVPRSESRVTTPRILVVEDSPSVGAILMCAFEQEGCTTTLARSGAQAIELARHWQPDLIALDLGLGHDVVATLK